MDINKIKNLAQEILNEISGPQTNIIQVNAGSNLQSVHDNVDENSILVLESGTYVGPLNNRKNLTWLSQAKPPDGRINPGFYPVIIRSNTDTITNTSTGSKFSGITVMSDDFTRNIFTDFGRALVLDKMILLGSTNVGQRRGFMAHGQDTVIQDSWIDECWNVGRDAMALGGWEKTKNLLIKNSYLGGGAQSLYFGGADAANEASIPDGIVVQKCTLSKNPAWYAKGAQIKTSMELKCAKNVLFEDCIFEYAGISGGSTGYLMLLNVRNQDGKAPFSTVQNIKFVRCYGRHAGGVVNFLGQDDINPSGSLTDISFENCMFEDIDPKAGPWKGQGRVFLFLNSPRNITFDSVTVHGNNLGSTLYLGSKIPGFKIKNTILPNSMYGVKIDSGGSGWDELKRLNPDAVIQLSTSDTGAKGFPLL
jgi:hypothetical protein